MAIRLGEMLTQSGKLTKDQLDEALKSQVIFGGRLGTNLIELGYISEEELAHFLGEKVGVPCAEPGHFSDIPAEVISLLPRDLVEKYGVIPVSLDKKRLTLAMPDPSDLAAIDEISFRTGFIIRPLISPEVRLISALEKYYKIPRAVRYIPVSAQLKEQWKGKKEQKPVTPPASEAFLSEQVEELSELEVIEELRQEEFTLELLSNYLVQAENRDQIAEIILSYLAQAFDGCALFVVRGNSAYGWKGIRQRVPIAHIEELQVPLGDPSVLQLVANGRSFYIGPVSPTLLNAQIFQAVQLQRPVPVCLVPLLMMGRVVNILYVDNSGKDVGVHLDLLQQVVAKASMAFEILILKSKILYN